MQHFSLAQVSRQNKANVSTKRRWPFAEFTAAAGSVVSLRPNGAGR
jgi:hypothetical protein